MKLYSLKSINLLYGILFLLILLSSCINSSSTKIENTTETNKEKIDAVKFYRVLKLKNIRFTISSTGEGSIQQLRIQPNGPDIENQEIKMEVIGQVVNAEIEDLNSDGYPEVLIFTVSAGSGSYGDVIGFSVNAGKSLSRIHFPEITDNSEASKGYMGHDEFAIVESTLVRRYRTYENKDTNAKPTGIMRQIQYKLTKGENSSQFVIDKIDEYPSN